MASRQIGYAAQSWSVNGKRLLTPRTFLRRKRRTIMSTYADVIALRIAQTRIGMMAAGASRRNADSTTAVECTGGRPGAAASAA